MTAALIAIDVKFAYHSVTIALWTLHLLIRSVCRRMSGEKLNREVFIAFELFLRQPRQSLQFHECLRAISVAFVEETGYGYNTVNLLCRQLFLVFHQSHGSLHGTIVLLLIELALAQ